MFDSISKKPASNGLIIFSMAIGTFAIGIGEFATMGLLLEISKGLGISETEVGNSISLYALGVVVGAPLSAFLGTKFKRKSLLLFLAALYAVAHLGTALAPNYGLLLLARFVSGLPHGAYFGTATLIASSISEPSKRGQAVSKIMLGLSVAILIGNPLAVWLGQHLGWGAAYSLVAVIAIIAFFMIAFTVPAEKEKETFSFRSELAAFNRKPVWLTVMAGVVGASGVFSVFSYLAPTLVNVTKESDKLMPLLVVAFGAGSIIGMIIGGKLVDRFRFNAVGIIFVWFIIVLSLFPVATQTLWGIFIGTTGVGTMLAMAVALQTQLMEISGDAKNLGAAANQSAFNAANALGPWLAGIALDIGMGYSAPSYIGLITAVIGLTLWKLAAISTRHEFESARNES